MFVEWILVRMVGGGVIQVRDSWVSWVSTEDYPEEGEEALGTWKERGRARDGMIGGITPSCLCWLKSTRDETGIPEQGQSEGRVAMERCFVRLNLCFWKPVVWRRLVLFLFFSEQWNIASNLEGLIGLARTWKQEDTPAKSLNISDLIYNKEKLFLK